MITTAQSFQEQYGLLKEKVTGLESTRLATFNILEDLDAERERLQEKIVYLEQLQIAVTNIFEDLSEEKKNSVEERLATFNILEDLGLDREKLREQIVYLEHMRTATTNIFEDLDEERKNIIRERLATFNILEDLDLEKRDLEKSYKKLKELKELDESKVVFLRNISHELRTPITPITIQAEMLVNQELGKISPKQKESINLIIKNVERLDNLLTDLLEISRIQAGVIKLTVKRENIKEIIDNVVTLIESVANKKGLKMISKIIDISVDCDAQRIKQVLTNLLTNAVKFTSKGSITVSAEKKKDVVVISVKDTGKGISKENIPKLFVPFYQVRASYELHEKGTGLGLSIAKSMVQQHGGEIWVESAGEGKGSTFYFTLPLKYLNEVKK